MRKNCPNPWPPIRHLGHSRSLCSEGNSRYIFFHIFSTSSASYVLPSFPSSNMYLTVFITIDISTKLDLLRIRKESNSYCLWSNYSSFCRSRTWQNSYLTKKTLCNVPHVGQRSNKIFGKTYKRVCNYRFKNQWLTRVIRWVAFSRFESIYWSIINKFYHYLHSRFGEPTLCNVPHVGQRSKKSLGKTYKQLSEQVALLLRNVCLHSLTSFSNI